MARVLDFNEVQSSFMDITLCDPERTTVHLDIPTEEVINKLQNMQAELAAMRTGNKAAIASIYDLGACLINCNEDLFAVTGEELRDKYGMKPVPMLKFFTAYMAGIEELSNLKN